MQAAIKEGKKTIDVQSRHCSIVKRARSSPNGRIRHEISLKTSRCLEKVFTGKLVGMLCSELALSLSAGFEGVTHCNPTNSLGVRRDL